MCPAAADVGGGWVDWFGFDHVAQPILKDPETIYVANSSAANDPISSPPVPSL